MKNLDPKILNEFLSYEPDTGSLYWKERDSRWFPSQRACKIWNSRFAGKKAFTAKESIGCFCGRILDKPYKAHRVIWALVTGEWPSEDVDHINGDRSDNRFLNLRSVPHAENMKNMPMRSDNTSGAVGVKWDQSRGSWSAVIQVKGRTINLGRFNDFDAALRSRKQAEAAQGFHPNHGRSA